jgi:hypothetical protein
MNINTKSLLQTTKKLNSTAHPKDHTTWQSGIYPRDTRMVQHMQINLCDIPREQNEKKKKTPHRIILIIAEKEFSTVQQPSMMETLHSEPGASGSLL